MKIIKLIKIIKLCSQFVMPIINITKKDISKNVIYILKIL